MKTSMKASALLGIVAGAAAALLSPAPARAQSAAGQVLLQVFNVGGADTTLNQQDGIVGSLGCGATGPGGGDHGGGDLIQVLNTALGTTGFDDSAEALANRRDLFRFCDNFTTNTSLGMMGWDTDAGTVAAIRRQEEGLAPDELFLQADQAASLAGLQVANVTQRVQQLRLASRGLSDLGGYAALGRGRDTAPAFEGAFGLREPVASNDIRPLARMLERGLSAGDGLLGIDGLSGFINGQYTRIDADSTSRGIGSGSNGGGVTLGIDKQLGEKAFLGFAFGYSRLDTDFRRGFGESTLDDYSFSLYGSAFLNEQLYVDGIFTGSILRFDQEREVPAALGPAFGTLKSEPEGWDTTGDLGIGGEFHLSPVDLNPYVRVAVSYSQVDSFTEKGSTLALHIDQQDNTSVTSTLGLSASLPISTGVGVIGPYVRGEYVHEYGRQGDEISGNLALVPQAGFKLRPNSVDRNYATVGAGVAATLSQGVSAFVDYDVVLGYSNLVTQQATLGARLEF